ncbi:MAG: hypothetical protein IKI99_00480, partial [Firmicutes bacterium]|nr:hypothetical protein [Bacillota bacterium]
IKGKLNFKEEEVPKLLADTIVEIHAVEENMDLLKADEDRGYGDRPRQRASQPAPQRPVPSAPTAPQHSSLGGNPGENAVKVRIPDGVNEKQVLQDLQLIFRAFAGDTPVLIYLQNGKIVRTSPQGGVHPTIEFFDTVADLVGRPNIKGKPVF